MQKAREKRIITICLVGLFLVFLAIIKPFIMPMLLAAVVVILFFPVYELIKKKIKQKRRIASVTTTGIIFLLIILPSTWVAATLINQVVALVGHLDLKNVFAKLFSTEFYTAHVEPWLANVEARFHVKLDLLGILTETGKQLAKTITAYSPDVLFGTANFVFAFFIMLFGVYFLFLEGPKLVQAIVDISPLQDVHERKLLDRVREMIHATVLGYLVTGIIQGVLAAIIFAIVGLDAFVVFGVLTFFMSMVPLIGAMGVWLPVCVWLFLQGNTWQGFFVLVTGAGLISLIDNFIKPVVIQGKTKIHPLLVFFSIFGGLKLFGPVGILFGPVMTALMVAVIKIYREEYVS